ncbi:MAG: hypothetical protein K0R47_1599 [Brevibacillus sp.]|nr:hypothetical protein [Brevibacillus sp.]
MILYIYEEAAWAIRGGVRCSLRSRIRIGLGLAGYWYLTDFESLIDR